MPERKMTGRDFQQKRLKKAHKRLEGLVKKHMGAGMSEQQARQMAIDEMRDNPRGDWRVG